MNYLLLDLKDKKAKALAQAVQNPTCQKIMDYLSENNATESKIAKALDIPLPTVHYNMKQLVEGGLVVNDEFHYSEKGKEVNHYKLANKLIVISPSGGAREYLSKVFPVSAILLAFSGVLYYFNRPEAIVAKSRMAEVATMEAAVAADSTSATSSFIAAPSEPNVLLWFLMGGFFAIVVYFVIDYFRNK